MLLNLENLITKYNLSIKGVIHIGAHFGQEYENYKKLFIEKIMFFEPMENTFKKLQENVGGNAVLFNTALGNMEGEIEMFTETINNGQSSSILKPEYHLVQHPNIHFDGKEKVKITRLDNFIDYKENYNFINIDVQGYELEVFKGGFNFLNSIDYIMSEVNREELYKDCARIEQLDEFLSNYGFERVETYWAGGSWGDAFYIKNK
jgi:FkbM family methyltransferase